MLTSHHGLRELVELLLLTVCRTVGSPFDHDGKESLAACRLSHLFASVFFARALLTSRNEFNDPIDAVRKEARGKDSEFISTGGRHRRVHLCSLRRRVIGLL